jgi:hypothetical protein
MSVDLAGLKLSEMTGLCTALRTIGKGAESMEEVAQRVVNVLYDELADSTRARACVLARFYMTVPYERLEPDLRSFGATVMQGGEVQPSTKCLTLLATTGLRPEWNSRKSSRGHQAIPLPTPQVVEAIPMVSQLIQQFGLSVGSVVQPDLSLVLETQQHTYGVFFVPEAKESAYIPAKDDFVIPFHVRSVLGFGGLLPSGDMYAALMFTKLAIARSAADMFRNAAMNLKVALLPFLGRPIFREP